MPPKKSTSIEEMLRDLQEGVRLSAVSPNILAYKPHPKQEEFHRAPNKGRLYIGGNRGGKTVGGATETIWWLTGTHPYQHTPRPPVRGRCISVDFANGVEAIVKPEIKRWITPSMLINGSWEDSYNSNTRTLTLDNGSFLEFKSYDQDLDKHAGTSRHFCVPTDTSVLSRSGWVNSVKPGDEILTVNPETLDIEWKTVNFEYRTKTNTLVRLYSRNNFEAVVTPDHRWLVYNNNTKKIYFTHTKDLKKSEQLIVMGNTPDYTCDDSFAASVGMSLTDGRIDIPESWIASLPVSSVGSFFWACMGGDGNSTHKELRFTTVREDHARVVSIAATILGLRTKWVVDKEGVIRLTFKGTQGRYDYRKVSVDSLEIDYLDVEEEVWCPNTDNNTAFFQRNGDVFLSGNCWFDEEPPHSIFEENMMRLIDTDGHWWLTMTPVEGYTWTAEELYEPALRGDKDIYVVQVDMFDNPYLNRKAIEEAMSHLSEDDRRARREGKYVMQGGLIFKKFRGDIHVTSKMMFNPKNPNIRLMASMDHGINNATAWLWHLVHDDGTVFTFKEHYQSEWTIPQHVKEIKRIEAVEIGRLPELRVGDPAIKHREAQTGMSNQRAYAQLGIYIALANNDVNAGIAKMQDYLYWDERTKPKWYIHDSCRHLIKEMRKYRWKDWDSRKLKDKNNKKEEPHKKDDHAVDAARYLFSFLPEMRRDKVVEDKTRLNESIARQLYAKTSVDIFSPRIDPVVSTPRRETEWVEVPDEYMGGIW